MEPTDHSGNKYEKGSAITLSIICFLIFVDFIGIVQNHYNLVSDLIPDTAVILIDKPLLNQGVFMSFLLLISVLLRAFKRITVAFIVDIVNLVGFSLVASLSY